MRNPPDLLQRTKISAIDVLKLCATLPTGAEVGQIKCQLLQAATSVGVNYRAARRGRSWRDFVAKLSIVEEEAVVLATRVQDLSREAERLVAIVVAAKKTAWQKGL